MPLKIPDDAKCLIPDCLNTPELSLGVRLRRTDTGALWAPETHAYVCLHHGHAGARLSVTWTPTDTRKVTTQVFGLHPATAVRTRTTSIRT